MLVRVKRQKGPNENSYWQCFEYNGSVDVTVVTVINHINNSNEIYDIEGKAVERISWECSCLQGICGGCAMIINGKPALACDTFLKDLKCDELILEPLSKFPVVRDLMVDRSIIHRNLNQVNLYLKDSAEVLGKDRPQRYSISKCLKCGLCLEVCPNYQYGKDFFGGVFANDAYLIYSAQAKGKDEVIKTYNEHFVSNCSKALSCQSICPAKIETLTSILRMNRAKKD
jgi:succinate dehydrogenase / fumarate reductase iron-sulfur subunit